MAPVLAETGPNVFNVLYRSVSPWEMADILESRQIRGRCATFAGDRRCSDDCRTWFGTTIAPIIHSGEDYLRYTQSLPIWDPLLDALHKITAIYDAAYDELEAQRKVNQWTVDKRLHRTYTVTRELSKKLGDAYRTAIYALAKQAYTSGAKLPITSYVITIHGARGGTMFTDRDSQQRDAVEVCFPLSAASTLYDHIAGVDLIKSRRGDAREYETVGHVRGDQLDDLNVKLPSVRRTTAQTALNVFERLKPKLSDWIDV